MAFGWVWSYRLKKNNWIWLLTIIFLVFGMYACNYKNRHYAFEITHSVNFNPVLKRIIVNGHEYNVRAEIPKRQNYYVPYPILLNIQEKENLHIILDIENINLNHTQCHLSFTQKAIANACFLRILYQQQGLRCTCDYDSYDY